MDTKYDYIICGAGAAGLSLALRLANEKFRHLKILILDQSEKSGNDHTWCFWESENSIYDHILSNRFSKINFFAPKYSATKTTAPYHYKMLQSAPFYDYVWKRIAEHNNISFIKDKVSKVDESPNGVTVFTSKGKYISSYVFSSLFSGTINKDQHLYVSQHFKGWFIKTDEFQFDPRTATFMDFRIDQSGDTRFFYVLPLNEKEALVEIAVFSNDLMHIDDYDPLIRDYIKDYIGSFKYEIREKEYGVIPMTCYPFWEHLSSRVFPIGTAGGAVKPSSGFAFKRIQQHSDRIANAILKDTDIRNTYADFRNRFYLYDKILLDVILHQKMSGSDVFTHLFSKNDSASIFKFLDGDTHISEEIRIFSTLPVSPFLRGWMRQKIGI